MPPERPAEHQRQRVRVKVRRAPEHPFGRSGRGATIRKRRVAMWVGGLVLGTVLVTAAQAAWAVLSLQRSTTDANALLLALAEDDGARTDAAVAAFDRDARRAFVHTRGPHWALATRLPAVGADAETLRTVAEVTERAADEVLPELVELAGVFGPEQLQPTDGRFDLAAIEAAQQPLARISDRLADVAAPVRAAPRGLLLGDVVGDLRDTVERSVEVADLAARAARALPTILGGDGPRTYLAVFQNNAELRATGGIPGAYGVITARDGRIAMVEQGDAADLTPRDAAPPRLTAEERDLFGTRMVRFAQSANFTPDFRRTAQILAQMWEAGGRPRVDGVVSADPVALARILGATGPVRVEGAVLDGDSAAELLLNTLYLREPDPRVQNDYFALAARRVFDRLAAGDGDAQDLLAGIHEIARQDRFLLWWRSEEEQELTVDAGLSGRLARPTEGRPEVGIYLNDATATKLDWYLLHRVDVASTSCSGETQELQVTAELHHRAPADAATTLPRSVLGRSTDGSVTTTVLAYAPPGASFTDSRIDGDVGAPATYEHQGHPVVARTVRLAPGERARLTYSIAAPGLPGTPLLRTTPGARTSGRGDLTGSSC